MKKQRSLGATVLFLVLLVILLISVYTVVLQTVFRSNTEESAFDRDIRCADAIHRLVSSNFSRNDFETINAIDDMNSARYQTLQKELNDLRSLNSTRYLYTAKRGSDGKLIYLVDGLDLDAVDFAYPGTYIEEEMIPYINAALSGQTIYSREIVDTTWGHIFTACYPVLASDGTGEVVGALCMEMDMEDTYLFLKKSEQTTWQVGCIAACVTLLLAACAYFYLRTQRKKELQQQEKLQKAMEAADAANKATFTVTIPFEIAPKPVKKEEVLKPETGICGLSLLLVEDNELNAEIARTLLEDKGAKVTCVENGKQAVDIFRDSQKGSFDAILMDVMMPVMDGLEATRQIRRMERPDAKTIPIIAMTANAFTEDARKCLDAGMNAHLAKPLDIEKVITTIAQCCRG